MSEKYSNKCKKKKKEYANKCENQKKMQKRVKKICK